MGKTILNITYGILIGLLAAGVIWLVASPPRGQPVTLLPTSTPKLLTVYVTGAVASPGTYNFPEGSRIGDAIQAAGGFIVTAEQDRVNLAALLEDGMHIDVPGQGVPSHISAGRVDINTATAEELDALPGIGPTAAQSIIDYRLQNGPFKAIQDIQNVPGIGPATYARIKDLIMVSP